VLLIAVTDDEEMFVSIDKKYENLSIRDSQLRDADKKRHGKDTVSHRI